MLSRTDIMSMFGNYSKRNGHLSILRATACRQHGEAVFICQERRQDEITQRKANFKPYESRSASGSIKHLRITHNMLNSKAWQQLDPYDITTYLYFKSKYYKKKNGDFNYKNISLTYGEMEPVMSWGRFKKSIDNLLRVGLIDIVRHRPQARDATIYGLSSRWHKYGEKDFVKRQRPTIKRKKPEP